MCKTPIEREFAPLSNFHVKVGLFHQDSLSKGQLSWLCTIHHQSSELVFKISTQPQHQKSPKHCNVSFGQHVKFVDHNKLVRVGSQKNKPRKACKFAYTFIHMQKDLVWANQYNINSNITSNPYKILNSIQRKF